jgi:hypothetical protein
LFLAANRQEIPMHDSGKSALALVKSGAVCAAAILASIILAAGVMLIAAPRSAQATPQFGTQTGLPCSQCHADLNTPAKLTDFGEAFHKNGDKVPEKR